MADDPEAALLALLDGWIESRTPFTDGAEEAAALRKVIRKVRPGVRQALVLRLFRDADGWRERPQVAVWGGRDALQVTRLAQARYGDAAQLVLLPAPEDVLNQTSSRTSAVLALGGERPWWGRLLARPRLKVSGALPELSLLGPRAALIVGEGSVGPSGEDETFWVTDAKEPSPRLTATLSDLGAAATLIEEAGGLKLFSLAGYFQADDARLARAPGSLTGVIGWAPLPFDL